MSAEIGGSSTELLFFELLLELAPALVPALAAVDGPLVRFLDEARLFWNHELTVLVSLKYA